MREPLPTAPTALDPAKVQDVATIGLLQNVYEGLVGYDEHNHIVGLLAESWTATDGGRTWTFTLRKNAKFHNGRSVIADDVKWSFERACSKEFASPTAGTYLRDIVGVPAVMAGRTATISGIEVLDPHSVRFTLDKPRAYFLGKLTYIGASIVAREAAGNKPIDEVRLSVGTGPFKLVRNDPDQEVELAANPDYYLGAPKLRRILRPIVKDASTRLNLYRTGALDTLGLERTDIRAVSADPALKGQLQFEMRPAVYYVALNSKSYPAFRNRHLRRAIAMAIDRDRICNVLLDGMPVAHGLTAPGVLGFRADYQGLPFDPLGARKELEAAGYPGGSGLPPLQFVYRTQAPDAQHVSEGVAASLRQNLGITVQLSTMDWGAFLDGANRAKFDMYFLSWYADYLDPQNFLSLLFMSDSPLNRDGYSNPQFDKLCQAGDTTVDEAARIRDYQQAEDALIQDAGRIPLYYQRDANLVSPRVHGLRENLFGSLPDSKVWLDGKPK